MSDQSTTGLGIDDVIGDKRAAVIALAAQYGVSDVRVFGSVARGNATADSDIDLLVVENKEWSLLDRIRFQQALEQLLEHSVDVVTEHTLHPLIRNRVLQEAQWL